MIHKTAEISKTAKVAKNVDIWAYSQVRENVQVGNSTKIGRNVYIDHDVRIGANVKIQNNAQIYFKTIVEDGVFIGPAVNIVNDKYPRAINLTGSIKTSKDWKPGKTIIKKGASIGAGSIVLPNLIVGEYVLVGAGSIVTKSVPAYAKVVGNPAKIINYVCKLAHELKAIGKIKRYCNICDFTLILKNE